MIKVFVLVLGTVSQLVAQAPSNSESIKFLALGDSYTIGESVEEAERWPEQLATKVREKGKKIEKPRIIAVTGWRTDQLKQAIEEGGLKNEYGLVSLLIGVNNQYQNKSVESYAPEFEKLLQTAVSLAAGKKENVFVVSIPDYGFTPFGKAKQEEISKAIDEFNDANKAITLKMGIQYVYITDLTREGLNKPEYVAQDGLHPSGKMYGHWVKRMIEKLPIGK